MDRYLIEGHKLFWHLDRVKEWQEDRVIPPIYIEVSPVSFCNHKCIFCGIDFAKQKAMLQTEILCRRLKEMGQIGVRSIMFAGEGEPILHQDLVELVKTTKESGIDVALTTNGTTGNYELWAKILPYLTWIKFSVDAGSPEIYAKVHNVPEKTFYKTLDSIRDAVKAKNDAKLAVTIGVQFLIIEENLSDIKNAINLFCSPLLNASNGLLNPLNIDYFVLKPYSLHPQMKKKKDVIYTEQTVKEIQNIIDEYTKLIRKDFNQCSETLSGSPKHAEYEKLTPAFQPVRETNIIFRKETTERYIRKEKNFSHCYALPFWGYISANGDFYTCPIFLGDERFKAGNIYKENMKDIIWGDKRKESIEYAEKKLNIKKECRLNCRMARANEFLEFLNYKPMHINFI